MDANINKKVKFIRAWYNLEKSKLSEKQKLELLNKWIAKCTKYEEYEMSNALLEEKKILIKSNRIKRNLFSKMGCSRTSYG